MMLTLTVTHNHDNTTLDYLLYQHDNTGFYHATPSLHYPNNLFYSDLQYTFCLWSDCMHTLQLLRYASSFFAIFNSKSLLCFLYMHVKPQYQVCKLLILNRIQTCSLYSPATYRSKIHDNTFRHHQNS